MDSSYKKLFKNIGLLTVSNFASKFLAFFLVPLYTNVLSTAEYGTYDMFNITIGVLIPILTLNIRDAVMRFAIKKDFSNEIIKIISIKYFGISVFIISILLITNNIFTINDILKDYSLYFLLLFIVQTWSEILLYYVRGIDKIYELSLSSIWASVFTIICNILFLLVFHWGLVGYFLANVIGPLVQIVYLMIKINFLRFLDFRNFCKIQEKEMISYSKPMIANTIAWWVNNASDRYIVIFFCGLASNGIYSVASKIPSILNIFQTIFNQAWTLSAVNEFDAEDKNGFFTNMYQSYNCFMVLVCSLIILFDKILASILYANDFYSAWIYVPWLTIAILFGALSGYLGGFFSATMNSKIFANSTVVGAVFNIVLNFCLTPFIGPLGAAISTTISYFLVWLIRYSNAIKLIKIKINIQQDLLVYFLLVIQSIIVTICDGLYMYIFNIFILIIIIIIYRKVLYLVLNTLKKKIHN